MAAGLCIAVVEMLEVVEMVADVGDTVEDTVEAGIVATVSAERVKFT